MSTSGTGRQYPHSQLGRPCPPRASRGALGHPPVTQDLPERGAPRGQKAGCAERAGRGAGSGKQYQGRWGVQEPFLSGSGSVPGEQESTPTPAWRLPLVLDAFLLEVSSQENGPLRQSSGRLVSPYLLRPHRPLFYMLLGAGRTPGPSPALGSPGARLPSRVAQLQLSLLGRGPPSPRRRAPPSVAASFLNLRSCDTLPVVLPQPLPPRAAQNTSDKLYEDTCYLLFFRTNKVPSSFEPIHR